MAKTTTIYHFLKLGRWVEWFLSFGLAWLDSLMCLGSNGCQLVAGCLEWPQSHICWLDGCYQSAIGWIVTCLSSSSWLAWAYSHGGHKRVKETVQHPLRYKLRTSTCSLWPQSISQGRSRPAQIQWMRIQTPPLDERSCKVRVVAILVISYNTQPLLWSHMWTGLPKSLPNNPEGACFPSGTQSAGLDGLFVFC